VRDRLYPILEISARAPASGSGSDSCPVLLAAGAVI
jgi:hypothetical protein